MSQNKNAPRKRKPVPKRPSQQPQQHNNNPSELWNIAGLFVSLYLLVSLYIPGSGGAIGVFLAGVVRGLFGIGGYLVPFMLAASFLYRMIAKVAYPKTLVVVVLYVIGLTFVHMLWLQTAETTQYLGVFEVFSHNLDYHFVANGGLLGALLGNAIHTLFGFVGAIIFVVAATISFFVLLTNRSFGNGVAGVFNFASDKTADAMERRAQRQAERAILEEEIVFEDKPRKAKTLTFPVKQAETSEDELTEADDQPVRSNVLKPDFSARAKQEQAQDQVLANQPVTTEWLVNNRKTGFILLGEEGTPITEGQVIENKPTPEPASTEPTPTQPVKDISYTQMLGNLSAKAEELAAEPETNYVNPTQPDLIPAPERADTPAEVLGSGIKILNEEKPKTPTIDQAELEAFNQSKRDIAYAFPTVDMLATPPAVNESLNKSVIYENTQKLEKTLADFGVSAKVVEVSKGPTVTRYELTPGTGVKVSRISGLADDLALSLAAKGIRIEAPIPGKSAVGIEIPNATAEAVYFRELIESDTFRNFPSNLAFAIGKDIAGNVMVSDLAKMPHLLIAGATGAGKSVCINTIIVSLLYKSPPEAVKLIMIDPKIVELSVYNGIPHLLIPVVTDPKKAAGALNWAVREMDQRYHQFEARGARKLDSYNQQLIDEGHEPLPQIVIIIDELADLMMVAKADIEESIIRLGQKARAAGIHLIIATQRPSVDVITGLIKANVPSRLAFSVGSGVDSRTILDGVGAEKLLGRGDMLFKPIGENQPQRIQGAFISDSEVESIVDFLKDNYDVDYEAAMVEEMTSVKSASGTSNSGDDFDEFFSEAVELILEKQKASTSMLQRAFRIGYQRAARLIEFLEEQGIIGPEDGSKPRKVIITRMQWEAMQGGSDEV